MGLFDIFKKKTLVVQPKTYTCARCKKEITDEETKWIGNHRFCADCAAPPKTSMLEKHFENEAQEAGYQAYMDFARGSLTPEQAYSNRGFVKDQNGKWVYKNEDNTNYKELFTTANIDYGHRSAAIIDLDTYQFYHALFSCQHRGYMGDWYLYQTGGSISCEQVKAFAEKSEDNRAKKYLKITNDNWKELIDEE